MKTQTHLQLLIDALRSGAYDQKFYAMRRDGGFCILGVACEVYRKHTGKGSWIGEDFYSEGLDRPDISYPPPVVQEWCAFLLPTAKLAYLNDDRKHDFNQIADMIETGKYPEV